MKFRPDLALSDYLLASAALLKNCASSKRDATFESAVTMVQKAVASRACVLVCGNGGSAADSLHLAAELTGKFRRGRKALNVVSLAGNAAFLTAWCNDGDPEGVFERQVEAHAAADGVLIAISTSGNSPSVLRAAARARDLGMAVLALTGVLPNKLALMADVAIDVPSDDTAMIQQVHICYYHHLCTLIELRL